MSPTFDAGSKPAAAISIELRYVFPLSGEKHFPVALPSVFNRPCDRAMTERQKSTKSPSLLHMSKKSSNFAAESSKDDGNTAFT